MATTKQVKHIPNPKGVGGFQDHPELRSNGGWKKEMVFSYQYNRFMNMTATQFEAFAKTPKDKMTMVELGAYMRVKAMLKSLPDIKEITDRTEGKAFQNVDVTSGGDKLEGLIIIQAPDADDQA
jgi:hypothetical protein